MNRLGTAVLAAIEGIVTVGVGVGIALVPLTLLWGFEYGLQVDWDVFWKASGSVWLVGHGVDVTFLLGSAAAKASGVSGAAAPMHVTLAALGFAIVTAWLGARAGRRFAETAHRTTGVLVGTAVVAVLGLAIALSSTSAATDPSAWQSVVFPALWFGIPAFVASEVCRVRRMLPADAVSQRAIDLVERIPAVWRAIAGFGLRAGTAATAAVVAVAGVVVAVLLFASFAEVITLYERSHAGVVGGVALTVGQLAFLPDLVGWATAWLVGPGFAIGTGSNVSPIGTVLGPIPGIPVFGALPASGHTFGLVWVLVPVIAGFAVAGLLRPRLVRALGAADSALHRALGGVSVGVVAGVLTGAVAWVSSGSLGPGRLADVGPHALVVGAFAALEVGVPAVVALAVGSDLVRLPERRPRWTETDEDDADAVAAEGSLLDALDRAGAGRTTDVHRFVVEEVHEPHTARTPHGTGAGAADGSATGAVTEPVTGLDDERADRVPTPTAGRDRPERVDDEGVELPEWARTDVVASDRVDRTTAPDDVGRPAGSQSARTGLGSVRDRLRSAADGVRGGVRDRAAAVRDRIGGDHGGDVGGERAGGHAAPLPTAPGTEQQPAFPWSTEEFVAGHHDETTEVDDARPARSVDPVPPQDTRRADG
ncbi:MULTISPECIES: cell division protein PerM, partial [Curtobacterium]|uniref:cell division protein PerM n=1 Tax=Curtobacterium flaccumfaciens TaxID=2035 RepID=UPI003EE7349E